MANDGSTQFISLQGCTNFRDLGGYQTIDGRTVKSRTLFRADSLQSMTAADTAYVESNLGIVMVFDLRNTDEALESGRWPAPDSQVQYHNVPFLEGWDMSPPGPGADPLVRLSDSYHWVITNSGDRIVEILTMLAEASNLPAVFHCMAGKDRTGILSAMVLGMLGVDDEQIIEDYCLTNQIIDSLGERIRSRPGNEHRSVRSFEAQPELMEQILNEVRGAYGGAAGYARAYGISDQTIVQLKKSLLE